MSLRAAAGATPFTPQGPQDLRATTTMADHVMHPCPSWAHISMCLLRASTMPHLQRACLAPCSCLLYTSDAADDM
eukprot:6279816-Alexandrium_andersonii.AAC.1